MKSYNIRSVSGDRYGGIWPVEQFGKFGIAYEQSAKPKSDLYVDLLPLLNSCRVELIDHQRLVAQLTGLERHTARGGRDSIDHAPGAHDDVSNAVAGVVAAAVSPYGSYDHLYRGWGDTDADDPEAEARAWRAALQRLSAERWALPMNLQRT